MSESSEDTGFYNKRIAPVLHGSMYVLLAFIFVINVIMFYLSHGSDPMALGWITFSIIIMHEEDHWWKKRKGGDKIAVAQIHMCKCYVDENKDCSIGCGDERENRKEKNEDS